ncbi:bestrophin-like domain [Thiorhodovibrio frisius]|uniref:DUF4239 domain-containing protein n=1 Tax=Thiorhodovibrio frisius TaxID=631362 RepID=H8Z738_9GAMM|nr:hypothetical protein [Thiorhodovibrio frisius]EIC20837.1 hypothetical protein Thi970DRAFT_04502 [Thiorhodovibrio frisius]WPL21889.1 hypothetical protein Thiofri_02026 [Thiorhodovibrio frisius]
MTSFFYQIPIWGVVLLFFVLVMIAIEIGYRAGHRTKEFWESAEAGGGNVVLSSMLLLLGLILALTFSASVGNHQSRQKAVITDANAIGKVFLLADLVAKPEDQKLKKALLEYARTQVITRSDALSSQKLQDLIQESTRAAAAIWQLTEEIVQEKEAGAFDVSLGLAVTDLFGSHRLRNWNVFYRLPGIVLAILVIIATASLAIGGFNAGISGRISRSRMTALALVLSGVMLLLVDIDHPVSGFIQVDQEVIQTLIDQIQQDLGQ